MDGHVSCSIESVVGIRHVHDVLRVVDTVLMGTLNADNALILGIGTIACGGTIMLSNAM